MNMAAAPDSSASKNIVWLASYPKSGNTWTRILFANLVGQGTDNDTDDMRVNLAGSISSHRPRFDYLTGLPSSDLTDDEIDLLRPALYREVNGQAQKMLHVKVHDAYHLNNAGDPIFPADISVGAIYIIRNPMDVAISYAYHQGHEDFTKVVRQMGAKNNALAGGHKSQLRQKTMGWSGHYRSWTQQTEIPTLVIRYEDMLADTISCLKKMALFLGLPEAADDARIKQAVAQSKFEKLREQEDEKQFIEKPEKAERFFRSGRAGEGAEKLSEQLQRKIVEDHHGVMAETGYLSQVPDNISGENSSAANY